MNKEHTTKLLTDFPNLYQQYQLPMTMTCMCWGFDCGDGWFDLIYRLSKAITEQDANAEATQVKEKFGTLRFYTGGISEAVWKLINDAEDESGTICEVCGTKENVSINESGWLSTLCTTCREEKYAAKTQG